MNTLSNMPPLLTLSAPLLAATITPPPPPFPEKLSKNKNLQDISRISRTFTSTVITADTPLIADIDTNTFTPKSAEEESAMLPPLTVEEIAESVRLWSPDLPVRSREDRIFSKGGNTHE